MSAHEGLRVIVTGAASGIGRGIASRLQEAEARVVGLDIDEVSTAFPMLRADLRNEAEIVAAVASAADRLGGLDAIVNAAGIGRASRLDAFNLAAFDEMFSVNVRGAVIVAREALRYLDGRGRIVNISSELAYIGRANASGYCATKAAMLALTRSWARELAPDILVNAIAPGPIDTEANRTTTPQEMVADIVKNIPLSRMGQPDDLVGMCLFLLSDEARWITGQIFNVDGGQIIRS